MNKRDVLKLLRECVVEATEQYYWTEELPDGYYKAQHIDYIDVKKMLAAIDSRIAKIGNPTKLIGPDLVRMG